MVFMTCSVRFNIQSEGTVSQLWNIVERQNLVYICICSPDTHLHKM